jgi:hypothetical protein
VDNGRFDDVVRSLAGSVTRRSLAGLMAGLVAGPVAVSAASRKRGVGKPGVEGPCGDGTRKDNMCEQDGDCCTGICKTGLKNKDGKGRCRCVRKQGACTADENCCKGLPCNDGICGGPTCAPPQGACTDVSECCNSAIAVCIGTCCMQPGAACAAPADCCAGGAGGTCANGFCCTNAGFSPCAQDSDCCGGATCTSGTCVS